MRKLKTETKIAIENGREPVNQSTDSPAQLFTALLNFPRQDCDCLFFNKQTGFTTLLERPGHLEFPDS